jgi:hypothetical protein
VIITSMTNRQRPLLGAAIAVLLLAGCGSSSKHTNTQAATSPSAATSTSAATSPTTTTTSSGNLPPAVDELRAAQHPQASAFPSASGRSLKQLAAEAKGGIQFGPATGVYVPGVRRIAFGLNASSGAFVYAPTAVYVSTSPTAPARGPFLAPADPVGVEPQYRSQQNAAPGGLKAIYEANIPLPHKGTFTILTLTKTSGGLLGATGEVAVAASSPIPDVGQRPPDVATDTLASVNGDASLLTTRIPPESMHAVSLNQVLGKRPVALLISTPQLCTSRVCGPVTDILVQLQHQFGSKLAFIHQEVYVDNQPSKGLRPPLQAFHLQTEPWLFTIDRQGKIVARLEGAYGLNAARQALEAALK